MMMIYPYMNEHKRDIRLGNLNNALLYISKIDHNFDFNPVIMLTHIHNKRLR